MLWIKTVCQMRKFTDGNYIKLCMPINSLVVWLYTLKIKVLHDAIDIEEPFLSKWFYKEPLTSEEPFFFT